MRTYHIGAHHNLRDRCNKRDCTRQARPGGNERPHHTAPIDLNVGRRGGGGSEAGFHNHLHTLIKVGGVIAAMGMGMGMGMGKGHGQGAWGGVRGWM